MDAVITLLPGDGIGPDVTECVQQVMEIVGTKYDHNFRFDTQLIGGAAIDATGDPLPAALSPLSSTLARIACFWTIQAWKSPSISTLNN